MCMSCMYTRQMIINNYNFHFAAESHKWLQNLAIGDEVMIKVHLKRFPLETLKRLYTQRNGPYKILKRFYFQRLRVRYSPWSRDQPVVQCWKPNSLSHFHDASGFQFVHSHRCWGDSPLRRLRSPSQFDFINHVAAIRQWRIFQSRRELMGINKLYLLRLFFLFILG